MPTNAPTTPTPADLLDRIRAALQSGGAVMLATYARAYSFNRPHHAERFRLDARGELEFAPGRGKVWYPATIANRPALGIRIAPGR